MNQLESNIQAILSASSPVPRILNEDIVQFENLNLLDDYKKSEHLFISVQSILFDILKSLDGLSLEKVYLVDTSLTYTLIVEYFEQTAPFLLLEDMFDVLTVSLCENAFSYLEVRRDRLVKDLEPRKGKALILLRVCNELMKRLSKSMHTVFCGRILIYLALAFPLSERSGVNLKGDFNVENSTLFEQDDSMDLDDKGHKQLYTTVWELQAFFCNPVLLLEGERLSKFQDGFQLIYDKFSSMEPSSTRKSKSRNSQVFEQHFFPKYLSGSALFDLELQDVNFQRQILIQFLIVLQFLYSQTSKEKETLQKVLETSGSSLNKSLSYSPPQFSAQDEAWISETRIKCLSLIEKTRPYGRVMANTLLLVMQLEKNWIHWKNLSCPSFERDGSVPSDPDFHMKTFEIVPEITDIGSIQPTNRILAQDEISQWIQSRTSRVEY